MPDLPPTATYYSREYNYDPRGRLLTICVSGIPTVYEMIPLDDEGYRLIKEGDGLSYDVLIHPENPRFDLCNCPAGRWGKACKHVHAIRDLTIPKPTQEG